MSVVNALRRVHATRTWAHVWVLIEALGASWALEGRSEPAAVLLAATDHRGRRSPPLARRRARAEAALDTQPERPDWARRGASMTIDELVAYTLTNLEEGADPNTGAASTTTSANLASRTSSPRV
jgi:hypothetical protein